MKNKIFWAVVVGIIILPFVVSAAETFSQTRDFIISARNLVGLLTGVLSALALLVFIWGLVKYIAKADDEGAKEDGRRLMINGAIALFVLFSIFGIVRFLARELQVPNTGPISPPLVAPTSGQ